MNATAFAMERGSVRALDDMVLNLGDAVVVVGKESLVELVLPAAYFDDEEGDEHGSD